MIFYVAIILYYDLLYMLILYILFMLNSIIYHPVTNRIYFGYVPHILKNYRDIHTMPSIATILWNKNNQYGLLKNNTPWGKCDIVEKPYDIIPHDDGLIGADEEIKLYANSLTSPHPFDLSEDVRKYQKIRIALESMCNMDHQYVLSNFFTMCPIPTNDPYVDTIRIYDQHGPLKFEESVSTNIIDIHVEHNVQPYDLILQNIEPSWCGDNTKYDDIRMGRARKHNEMAYRAMKNIKSEKIMSKINNEVNSIPKEFNKIIDDWNKSNHVRINVVAMSPSLFMKWLDNTKDDYACTYGISYLPKIPYVKAIVDISLESEPDTIFAADIRGSIYGQGPLTISPGSNDDIMWEYYQYQILGKDSKQKNSRNFALKIKLESN